MPGILDLDGLDTNDNAPLPSPAEVRSYLSGLVDWALSLLDTLDEPTTDLEPQGDEEPSLGSLGGTAEGCTFRRGKAPVWAGGPQTELWTDAECDVHDDPHDGELEERGEADDSDAEPSLGSTEAVNQVGSWNCLTWITGESEPNLGATGTQQHLHGWSQPTPFEAEDCEEPHDAEAVNEDGDARGEPSTSSERVPR